MFVFIPKRLQPIKGKPGIEKFPANVLMAGIMDFDDERRLVSVLYDPDFSTAAGTPGFTRGSTSAVLARGYKPRASGEPKARPLTRR